VAAIWNEWIWPILQFLIGLNLVVFFHELGHFLLAKRADIRVERFAVGFGPRLVGFRRGETDYCLKAIPFGGYVAMAGQEDFGPQPDATDDPRAFCNKSVGARLSVISAGVVMNVIFAALLFVIVGLVGKQFMAPVVGGVEENMPAAEAKIHWVDPPQGEPAESVGLRAGDRITKIEGDSIILALSRYHVQKFQDVAMAAALADLDETYTFTIERPLDDGTKLTGHAQIGVEKVLRGSVPAFGIAAPSDVVFDELPGVITDSPFRAGDRVVAINGDPVRQAWQIQADLGQLDGDPVTVTVQRGDEKRDVQLPPVLLGGDEHQMIILDSGQRYYGRIVDSGPEQVTVHLQNGEKQRIERGDIAGVSAGEPLSILGMVPRLKVAAVKEKLGPFRTSPARRAGLRPGDVIIGYGDRGAPTFRELLEINDQAAGTPTQIVVLRDGKEVATEIAPRIRDHRALIGMTPTVEMAPPYVAGVRSGSVAAEAGIESGMVVEKVNGHTVSSWIDLFRELKQNTGRTLDLTCRRGVRTATAELGPLTEDVFDPAQYAFELPWGRPFKPLTVTIQKRNPVRAIGWGSRETLRMVLSAYVSLRSMVLRNISAKSLTGPVGIGQLAIEAGRESLTDLIYFIAFISAVIAVFNFLPLPVLDGGHALFLLIEKLRGKPLPMKVMNIIQTVGLVLLIGLFIAITWQDISRML